MSIFDENILLVLDYYLTLPNLLKLSKLNKNLLKLLTTIRQNRLDKIPWKITSEYHFRKSALTVHQMKVEVGNFDLDPICDYCSERNWTKVKGVEVAACAINSTTVLSSEDIKTTVVSGIGGTVLLKLLKNGDHVPLWFCVDYSKKVMLPMIVGYDEKPPVKTTLYYDEASLITNLSNLKNSNSNCLNLKRKRTYCNTLDEESKTVVYKGVNYKHLLNISLDDYDSCDSCDSYGRRRRSFKKSRYF